MADGRVFTIAITYGDADVIHEVWSPDRLLAELPGLAARLTAMAQDAALLEASQQVALPSVLLVEHIVPLLTHCLPNGRLIAAKAIMKVLFTSVPQVRFLCRACSQAKGECRCATHGYLGAKTWEYLGTSRGGTILGKRIIVADHWGIDRASLAALRANMPRHGLSPSNRTTLNVLLTNLDAGGA